VQFPGQIHKWRLAEWLQKGTEKNNIFFNKNLSKAIHLIIITAKSRIASDFFSLTKSLKAWKTGTTRLLDILIGLPAMKVSDYQSKMLEEEQAFLIAELIVDVRYFLAFDMTYQNKLFDEMTRTNLMTKKGSRKRKI
jgi:hypothetical protein